MAKKKKNKNPTTLSGSTEPRTSSKNITESNSAEDGGDFLGEQIIHHKKSIIATVHLGVGGKKSSGSYKIKEENERIIHVHEEDAKSLVVSNGEYVIVSEVNLASNKVEKDYINDDECYKIKWDEMGPTKELKRPKFLAICKVKIVKSSKNTRTAQMKHSTFSPKSPTNSKTKNTRDITKGEVRFQPISLHQQLFESSGELSSSSLPSSPSSSHLPTVSSPQPLNNMNQPKTPTLSHSSTPQSSTTTNFSFKSFLKSPSSDTKSSHRNQQHTKIVVILPLKAHEVLSKYLILSTPKLRLRLVRNAITSSTNYPSVEILRRSTNVLQRMILLACQDNFFRCNDRITISFQGTKIQFEVCDQGNSNDVENQKNSTPNEIKELSSSITRMTLENENHDNQDFHDDNIEKDILSQSISYQVIQASKRHLLMYISMSTRIEFEFDDKENGGNHPDTTVSTGCSVDRYRNKIVAGLDPVLQQVHAFLKPTLLHPELFPKTGPIRAPKGLLLHGSSGCGKSLLAKQIEIDVRSSLYTEQVTGTKTSNTDKKIKVDVTYINCASIQATTSIIGEAERKLSKIFEKAEYETLEGISTLLILDDVHLICPRRGAAGGGESDRVASTLLALMDGIGGKYNHEMATGIVGNIVILAITSHPTLLDPALRRAGRLDNEIEVPNPDDSSRAEIFDLILNRLKRDDICLPKFDSDLCLSYAKLAKGFTGGDCALCMKEAVRLALLHPHNDNDEVSITDADIRRSIKITKPSAIKSLTVEIPSIPWSSIGGMDGVKRLLREAVELPMTHAHLFEALRIPPPRGVLLYGPPGCSKTLMARALATEGNMNFLAVKGPELLSKWLGESERQLASLFRRARLASPCVIFFDEIDAIASKRGSSESSGGERMLSQLLTELDGINMTGGVNFDTSKSQPRVLVVGATNRPDLLDTALTRPGRIDRMIYVGLPDQASREAIFELQFKGKSCDSNLNIKELGEISDGFSGAEIVSICREAALYAIEELDAAVDSNSQENSIRQEPMIQMHHVIRSLQKTKRQITPQMLEFYSSYGSGK